MNKKTVFSLAAFAAISAAACSRSPGAPAEFRGRVFAGVQDSSGTITLVGPLSSARVILVGDNTSALTDTSGNYILKADVPRSFTANNVEYYTLEAVAPLSWAGRSQRQAATGRPGDIIYVRDFVLYRHYYSDTPGATPR